MTLQLLLAMLTGLAGLCLVLGLDWTLRSNTIHVDERLRRYTGRTDLHATGDGTQAASAHITRRLTGGVERSVSGRPFVAALRASLARGNLTISVGEFLLMQVLLALIAGGLALLISGAFPAAVAFGVAAWFVPRVWLGRRQAARLRAFNDQLADAMAFMANSLRSGLSLVQTMETMTHEAQPPLSEEFRRVVREVGLGVSLQEALRNLGSRVASNDLDLIVTAVLVQFEIGGNLAKILDSIATTIRERVKLKGEIKTLSAQGRMSGYILSGMPVVIGGILMLIAPGYIGLLFTPGPWIVLPVVAGGGVGIGSFVMNKIVEIDV